MNTVKKNIFKLLIGNAGVQVISLAFYPFITRRYSPVEFGLFGVANSIVLIISVFSFGQLHTAILAVKDNEEQDRVFTLSLFLNAFASFILGCIFFLLYWVGKISSLHLLIPIAVFFYSIMEIHKNWMVANHLIGTKTLIININRIASNGLKLFGSSAMFLFASEIFSNIIGSLIFFKYSFSRISVRSSFSDSIRLIKKYKDFPLFYTFYVLAQVLGSEAIVVLLQKYLPPSEVGVFFLGNKLFVQTALVLSSTLSFSFSHRLVGSHVTRITIFEKALRFYAIGILLAFALSVPDYTPLVTLFFGEKWTSLSGTISFFIFLTPIKLFVGFFAYMVLLSGHTKFISIFKTIQFVILLCFLSVGFTNLREFLWMYVPFEVVFDSFFIVWSYRLIKRAK